MSDTDVELNQMFRGKRGLINRYKQEMIKKARIIGAEYVN